MVEAKGPRLFTIPAHRAFADALAAGLIRQFGGDDLGLARGLVLLPNNRAKRALTDAFVRASAGGLLLPRMIAIGDPALDEAVGAAFDPADDPVPVPPAVAPLQRRMILARLVSEERARGPGDRCGGGGAAGGRIGAHARPIAGRGDRAAPLARD
ncbi:double-strand break repair protein [compost metagenome]